MPSAVIEYKNGKREEFDFFRGGEYAADRKATQLLEDQGHKADKIYTTNWENDLDNIYKWEK